MTLSAVGMLAALGLFLGGARYFGRQPAPLTRIVGTAASIVVAVVLGWLAWYAGTAAGGA